MTLLLRDHKTSRSGGFHQCLVPEPVKEMFKLWMQVARPLALGNAEDPGFLFFNENTRKAFKQQGFSRFMGKSFKGVVGMEDINLQTIRRIFAEGAGTRSVNSQKDHTPGTGYLKDHTTIEDWNALAVAMLTGVRSLQDVYCRDGRQKRSHEKVRH